jgi:glycosidase
MKTFTLLPLNFLLLFLISFSGTLQAKKYTIEHLEPLSWWNKMQSNQLQLMIHGKDISSLTPKISHPDITIINVNKVINNNYLFLDLQLADTIKAGDYEIAFYQDNTKILSQSYRINERNKISAAATSFSGKDVIYLLTPDRFSNGDVNNDNVKLLKEQNNRTLKDGRHGGDIQGIIDNLGYIQEMGFTQIWPNPMIENNQPNYSYHGYSATDFYKIDARFGSNELFKRLSEQAQFQGLGLIKDVVLNHIGDQHWWLNDLPTNDWLNFQNKTYTGTHHKRESLHDPHATEIDKTLFSDGWFVPSMPDLNQRNKYLSTYLIQNTLWWIEYANLSGVRVDTYSYPDKGFLTDWTKRITDEYPNINIVGEEWTTNPAHVAYWQRGKQTHDNYVSYLPSVMDFPLQASLINGLKNEDTWSSGLIQLYQAIANDFQYADPYNLVTFADNHDMSRIYTQLDENFALYKMAMSYLLTTRGIPQVFYGTEILMSNLGTDDHGVIRTDFPGGWSGDKSNAFTGKGLTSEQLSAQQYMKKLLNWRKTSKAIHKGTLIHFAPKEGIYVYFRNFEDETIMVVMNKNKEDFMLNSKYYDSIIKDNKLATDVISQKTFSLNKPISIEKQSVKIWKLTNN